MLQQFWCGQEVATSTLPHVMSFDFVLLYVHLLGYDVEFGHMEAVNLVTSAKYSEKSVVCTSVQLCAVC